MKKKSKNNTTKQKQPKKKTDESCKLSKKIEQLEQQNQELLGKLQRLSADYANFQKRVPKQIADTTAYEREKIIKTLLPALDNFDHTLQNAPTAKSSDVLIDGIKIIYDQMLDILKSHQVEVIEAIGENFDPALHQAMMQRPEPEKENNTVLEELQKGYKLNGRIIRPARVIVNKLPEEQATNEQTDESQQKEEPDTEQKPETNEDNTQE